jgi:tripartite-type tricarboxylate transporter receptor subunit TctC
MRRFLGLVALTLCSSLAIAQLAADRPIRILVPFSPGGSVDGISRLLSERMGASLGTTIIVENRLGAGGAIAADALVKSKPDGHTLLMGSASTHGTNSAVYRNLTYDAVRDFAPISMVARTPFILTVNASLPVNSTQELIKYARANPGKLNYASYGPGSSNHLVTELFKGMANVDIVHIPYKGSGPALVATLAGDAAVFIDAIQNTASHIKAGKLKLLGVGTATRSPLLPETPTIAESGVPGFEAIAYYGLFAPAATPRPTIDQLNKAVLTALAVPEVRDRLTASGNEVVGSSPEALGQAVAAEVAKWQKLVRDRGMKFD